MSRSLCYRRILNEIKNTGEIRADLQLEIEYSQNIIDRLIRDLLKSQLRKT